MEGAVTVLLDHGANVDIADNEVPFVVVLWPNVIPACPRTVQNRNTSAYILHLYCFGHGCVATVLIARYLCCRMAGPRCILSPKRDVLLF